MRGSSHRHACARHTAVLMRPTPLTTGSPWDVAGNAHLVSGGCPGSQLPQTPAFSEELGVLRTLVRHPELGPGTASGQGTVGRGAHEGYRSAAS